MKYTCELTLNVPRARVIELFDNAANLKRWQPDLISFEPVSGTPGQPGAKSRLVYQMGSRRIEMIETLTVRNLPDEFSGTYESSGVHNTVENRFRERDGQTDWDMTIEFQFTGFMRFMAWLMPGMFKKMTQKMMGQFKTFAESQARPA